MVASAHGYDDFSKDALETIGKNKSRNLQIMKKLQELNMQGKPTIVFACSVKHAQLLSAMLTLNNVPNAIVLYSQMIGRGLRGPQMGGNEICLLVDVKDNLKQYNENMAFSHFNNYWSA